MNVRIIGHPEAVQGFALVGIQGEIALNAEEANAALDNALAIKDVGIILVTDDAAAMIESRIEVQRELIDYINKTKELRMIFTRN